MGGLGFDDGLGFRRRFSMTVGREAGVPHALRRNLNHQPLKLTALQHQPLVDAYRVRLDAGAHSCRLLQSYTIKSNKELSCTNKTAPLHLLIQNQPSFAPALVKPVTATVQPAVCRSAGPLPSASAMEPISDAVLPMMNASNAAACSNHSLAAPP